MRSPQNPLSARFQRAFFRKKRQLCKVRLARWLRSIAGKLAGFDDEPFNSARLDLAVNLGCALETMKPIFGKRGIEMKREVPK